MHRFLTTAALAATLLSGAASAQSDVPARVGKLESEMRAVQRKVFPGGAGQVVQPEVDEAARAGPIPGSPSSSALVDMGARVTSLEGQMATLTGQIEQNAYKLRQLQDQFEAYRRATDARLATGATSAPPPVATTMAPPPDTQSTPRPAARSPRSPRATTATSAAGADDAGADAPRTASTASTAASPPASGAAIARPSTGDAAEDDYLYGYRLWQAKQYPAAEAQLAKVVATYPDSRRASYAQNLLGRAYLDEGKPSLAATKFYDNYKKMPDGERAPDSLYYLAQALIKLNKPADACKVYGELTDVYGAKIGAGMKADVARGRVAAKCP